MLPSSTKVAGTVEKVSQRSSSREGGGRRREGERDREIERPTSRVEDEVSVPELAVSMSVNLMYRKRTRSLISRTFWEQMGKKGGRRTHVVLFPQDVRRLLVDDCDPTYETRRTRIIISIQTSEGVRKKLELTSATRGDERLLLSVVLQTPNVPLRIPLPVGKTVGRRPVEIQHPPAVACRGETARSELFVRPLSSLL